MGWITRFLKNSKGAVTVIVTLLLIPSILISGTAVDVARIYSAKSIVQDANSLGANAAMAQYNALLKDLYGLYGIQDTKLQSMVSDYIKLAIFGDENTPKGMGTFQPFYGSESSLSISVTSEHNLGELEILQRQIEEYMTLRAPGVIVNNIMDIIKSLKKVSADADVIEDKLEIDDKLQEIHEIYKKVYQAVNDLDEYPNEEKIMLNNVNEVMDKIHSQFKDLKGTRSAYIKMQKEYRETKEKLEKQRDELKKQKSEVETAKQNKETEKQSKETARDSAQQDLNSAQQRLNNAQQQKNAAESQAEAQKKAAEERAEADRKEAEAKAEEEKNQEVKSEDEKTEEEKKAEAAKAEEEQKAAEAKAQEEQKAAQEAQQTQDQINQLNDQINTINGEINSANDQINQMNSAIDQLNNEIAQKEFELQTINESIEAVEKKLEQETQNYETKKQEYKDKYRDILLNIASLSIGGVVKKTYRSGKKDDDGNYIAGYWEDKEVIVPRVLGAGTLWDDNMSLKACKQSGYDLVERFQKLVDKVSNLLKEADAKKSELKIRLNSMKGKLDNCSTELKTGLTEKRQEYNGMSLVEYYEKILEYDLNNMASVVQTTDRAALDDMKKYIDDMGYGFKTDGILLGGKIAIEGLSVLATNDQFNDIEKVEMVSDVLDIVTLYADMEKDEYSFKSPDKFVVFKKLNEECGKFYSALEELMKSTGTQLESDIIKSLSQILKAAKSLIQGVVNMPEGADSYPVSIGSAVSSNFGTDDNWENTDQAKKSAKSSLSNPILAQLSTIANDCTNKLLLVSYGTGMFSCYATNKPVAADKKETSLTGVKFDKRVNYFYQSEQEFLFAGKSTANENLLTVSGMILLVRFVMDYVSAFILPEVKDLVRKVALMSPAPVNVILSELVRFVLAVGQAGMDLANLRMGYRVPLMHTQTSKTWRLSAKGIDSLEKDAVNLLDSCRSGNSDNVEEGKGFSYENYLAALLLMVDKTTLTQRIQLLIELNLTNYKNDVQANSGKMTSLERISLGKYAAGISVSTSVQMDTLFFTMKMFQDGINGVKPSTKYTIGDTIYRGY